jgi:hypothetical protein
MDMNQKIPATTDMQPLGELKDGGIPSTSISETIKWAEFSDSSLNTTSIDFEMTRKARTDSMIYNIIHYQNNKNKKNIDIELNEGFNVYFNEVLRIDKKAKNIDHIGTSYLETDIFDLLSYKMYDNIYYSDLIWDLDITKNYFDKNFEKGILIKETLKKMKEYVLVRDKLPESFIKLFDNPKCK